MAGSIKGAHRRACRHILAPAVILVLSAAGPQTSPAYEAGAVAHGGRIVGVVHFAGAVPPPDRYKVTMGADPDYCKTIADAKGVIEAPQAVVTESHAVSETVVFLQDVEAGKPAPAPGPVVAIDRCRFEPRLVAGAEGQHLTIAMHDRILHQIRGWEMLDRGRIPLFHLPGMNAGQEQAVPLRIRRSGIVKLECDQHRFMQGWLLVAANPYVAVTGREGRFELTDVPPGTHRLAAWHPALGYQEMTVTVAPDQATRLTVTLPGP